MPQDQFSGHINTEEASDCECAGYDVTSAEWFLVCLYDCAGHGRAPGTRPHTRSGNHTSEKFWREKSERLYSIWRLWALMPRHQNVRSPTNYQLTTVGWLPLNVVAARGQNTFVSTIKNLDFKHFYSCDYCVWCGRLILSPNVQIYPRIKQHLRPIMPNPGLELQTIHRLPQSWKRSLFLVQCAA